VIVRQTLDDPLAQARYWASSDLHADLPTLLVHIATRWDIEVLFGDGKEELGVDQYQLMSAMAIVRFWTLAMLAYVFLEEEASACNSSGTVMSPLARPGVKFSAVIGGICSIGFTGSSNPGFNPTTCMNFSRLERP